MRMLIIISTGVIRDHSRNCFHVDIIPALKKIRDAGHGVFLISNHKEPDWFKEVNFITYQRAPARQDGTIIEALIRANKKIKLEHSEVAIFGSADEDLFMAVNSRTLLIRCEWADLGAKIASYGVPWSEPKTLPALVDFLENKKPWYFQSDDTFLDVYSLTDAGTHFETRSDVRRLVARFRTCLKNGRPELKNAFILHSLSSIYATPIFEQAHIWGFYPSSSSKNDGSEIIADFCELARAMYKKQLKEPLFIRHKKSIQRHLTGGDRTDPASQVKTIHLNPFYRGKLKGKTVVVMDDYLTYGVSFGVSAALLAQAGAVKMIGVSMGKFGNKALRYDLNLIGDPFAPIAKFTGRDKRTMTGTSVTDAKWAFVKKFSAKL